LFAATAAAPTAASLPPLGKVHLRVAVLQPKNTRRDIGRNVLNVRHLGDVAVLVAEDLDRVIAVAVGSLIERTLDARVSFRLTTPEQCSAADLERPVMATLAGLLTGD
jgi:hypothetical protein